MGGKKHSPPSIKYGVLENSFTYDYWFNTSIYNGCSMMLSCFPYFLMLFSHWNLHLVREFPRIQAGGHNFTCLEARETSQPPGMGGWDCSGMCLSLDPGRIHHPQWLPVICRWPQLYKWDYMEQSPSEKHDIPMNVLFKMVSSHRWDYMEQSPSKKHDIPMNVLFKMVSSHSKPSSKTWHDPHIPSINDEVPHVSPIAREYAPKKSCQVEPSCRQQVHIWVQDAGAWKRSVTLC